MSGMEKIESLPDFQAIGTLAGTVGTNEADRYQLVTTDGLSLRTFFRGRVIKLIREQPELLSAVRAWTGSQDRSAGDSLLRVCGEPGRTA